MSQELGTYEDSNEIASKIQVMKAGDGLSTPLAAEPRGWHRGERLPILLWTTVDKIRYDPATEGTGVVRVHIVNTEEAAVLDHIAPEALDAMLATQREKVADYEREQARLKLEAKGITELPLDDVDGSEADPEGAGDVPDLPRGDWQADAAVTPPTPIGRRRKAAAD